MKASDYVKSFLPILSIVIIYAIVIFLFIIPYFEEQLLQQKKDTVKELTTNAISLINHFNIQAKDGLITIDEAKQNSIDEIKSLRYGKELKDYYWIMDTVPIMIAHPYRADLEGVNIQDYKDPEGNRLFVDAIIATKDSGAGFINYLWQWKDDSSRIVRKISYVKRYDEWGWIIGSGLYVEDVTKEIAIVNQKVVLYSLAVIAIAFILALYISYRNYKIDKEKRLAQEELIQSQKNYKEIVENASSVIIKLDLEGTIIFFNEYSQKLFGYSQNEVIGKHIIGTILPNDNFPEEKNDQIFEHIKQFDKIENWTVTKNGKYKYLAWNNKPIYTDEGNIAGILLVGTDITERKKLLDQLAESEKKFKLIFNSVTDGIIIFTVSGKIIEANKTAYERSGYNKEEYLQFPMQAFLKDHPVVNFDNLVEELSGKEVVSLEVNYRSRSGQLINIEVVARKMTYEGQEAYLAVTREISERIQIQHQIYNAVIEAEEKERSRVAKELHDGVSPLLSTIKLFSQSLKDCKREELKNELLKKIEETINESIQSVSDISNNLSPHILQNFGLIPALENFIEKIGHSKELVFHFDSDLKSQLSNVLDVTIYRIITELIYNTVKYAKAKNISISIAETDTIYLKYEDDGIGFDYDTILESKKGMGLFNISNRVKSLKGYAKFSPKAGNCKVEIELPKQ